ncbi:hypothetical protein C8R41DRAFT_982326 [Lentinula lateritia]|uniref:Uncharacterized protein n=1 Tax=Lentinula lateritia TaxID=40482 RepID=A0ABQ8VG40_9AGAR|nr:hypothetical protein C8R41DRAFT_982326 [Lentinula lateritia]
MNEGPESSISTLVHQNAAAMKELKLGFELAKYQFLVTSERVEAGMNTVKERLKQMLVHQQRITVKEHLDVCVTAACSSFSLHRIHRLYRVLLTLISLEHIILTENHFSIRDTWLPVVTGVGEMLAIQDMSSTRKNSSIMETETDEGEICDRAQGDMNLKPKFSAGAQSTSEAVDKDQPFRATAGRAAISGHDGSVGPPPQDDLPLLPPPVMNSDWGDLHVSGAVSHPRISVEDLPSTPHELSDIMADMTPENTLDIIEADLGHFAPSPSFTATILLRPPLTSPFPAIPPLPLTLAQDCSQCAGRTPSVSQDYLVDTLIDLIEAELKSSTPSDNRSVFESSPLLLLYTPPSLIASFNDFDPSIASFSSASGLDVGVNLPSEHSGFFEDDSSLLDPESSASWDDFGYTFSPVNMLSTMSAPATMPATVSSPGKYHLNILTSRILRSSFSSSTPASKRRIRHPQNSPSFFVFRSVINFKSSSLRKGLRKAPSAYWNRRRTLTPASTIIGGRVKVRKIRVRAHYLNF